MTAFGIKLSIDNGFAGDVVLEAKTTSLAKHYERNFGAMSPPPFAPQHLIVSTKLSSTSAGAASFIRRGFQFETGSIPRTPSPMFSTQNRCFARSHQKNTRHSAGIFLVQGISIRGGLRPLELPLPHF